MEKVQLGKYITLYKVNYTPTSSKENLLKSVSNLISLQPENDLSDAYTYLNNRFDEIDEIEKKGIEKALDYFSEHPEDKQILLEAVSVKKEKTVKSIDDKIQKIDKRLKALKEIKTKLIKDKKKKNELERIESLFR